MAGGMVGVAPSMRPTPSNAITRSGPNANRFRQLPTDCLQATEKEKPRYLFDSGVSLLGLVGRTRFELVTNGLKVLSN